MSDKTTPEDVAALLAHTQLNQYKVFHQERRSSGSDSPAQSIEPTTAPQPAAATSHATPEVSTLEFVRPQAPRWALWQDLGADSESPASGGDSRQLRVPTIAVLSATGGTGKTAVAATLGRALASTGDNILMIHGALQFSAPLHFGAPVAQAVQNLRQQLGTRLLPFCIRRSDVVAEALAAGMTVLDYAPKSVPAEDFLRLATWARQVSSS
jgi:Mrp family chromosome partitioning ATPase